MIRWSYVKTRLVYLVLLWIFFAFAFDPLLRRAFETAASKALGAKVEIGHLRTKLFPPAVELSRFQAASPSEPMKNLLEFQSARFQLEGRPLLEKKIIVSACDLTGLTWGTPRKTSGALRKPASSPAAEKLKRLASEASSNVFSSMSQNLANAKANVTQEYTIDPKSLSSVRMADKLQSSWPASFDAIHKRVDSFDPDGKVKEIQNLYDKTAQSNNIVEKLRDAKTLEGKIRDLRQQLQDMKSAAQSQVAHAHQDIDAVQAAKKNDLNAVLKKFQIPRLDTERLSAYLLGPAAASRLATVLRLVEAARERMPAKRPTPPPAKPAGMRGLTVEFPKEKRWPAFLLEHADLSGSVNMNGPISFDGKAAGFSSNPPLVGRPATLTIEGRDPRRKIYIEAVLDHTAESSKDKISFDYSGIPMPETTAGDPQSLAVTVSPGIAAMSGAVELDDNSLRGSLSFTEKNISIMPSVTGLSQDMSRIVESAFRGLKEIQAQVALSGTLDNPEFSVNSNLGKALAGGLEGSLSNEIKARMGAIQSQLDHIVQEKVDTLSHSLDAQNKDLLGKIGIGDQKLKDLQDKLGRQIKLPVPPVPGLDRLFK